MRTLHDGYHNTHICEETPFIFFYFFYITGLILFILFVFLFEWRILFLKSPIKYNCHTILTIKYKILKQKKKTKTLLLVCLE